MAKFKSEVPQLLERYQPTVLGLEAGTNDLGTTTALKYAVDLNEMVGEWLKCSHLKCVVLMNFHEEMQL